MARSEKASKDKPAEKAKDKSKGKSKSRRAAIEAKLSEVVLEMVGTETFGRSASVISGLRASIDRMVMDKMADQLASLNMPSREDIHQLGERLMQIENRLVKMEAQLERLAPEPSRPAAARKARRTRVAPSKAIDS